MVWPFPIQEFIEQQNIYQIEALPKKLSLASEKFEQNSEAKLKIGPFWVERIFLGKKPADVHRAKRTNHFATLAPCHRIKVLGSDGVFDNLYLEEASKGE